jgi:hypothetical protein
LRKVDVRILKGDAAVNAFGALSKRVLPVLAVSLALYLLGSTILGAYRNFSPVPLLDGWGGMVDFYVKSSDDLSVWWVQHNEHRIFFSKLLFWLDMRYFDGSGQLLVPMNILLLLSIWALLCVYANHLVADASPAERLVVRAILAMLCVSWLQTQNIISSFQSMFILVFLVPLLALYCYARALESPAHASRWRFLSLALGLASMQCMANGIFVLPMLAAMSWFAERSPRRFFIILFLAAVAVFLFLAGYQRSLAGFAGTAILLDQPWQIAKFALAYLGYPFHALFQRDEVPVVGGGIAVALAIYMFLTRSVYRSQPYALALFAYLGYVFASAGLTATGRILFGVSFAGVSRYMTPTLTAWAVLLILLLARSRRVGQWSAVALAAVAALLLSPQTRAFKIDVSNNGGTPHNKAVSALSLQLDLHDIKAKKHLALFYEEGFEAIFQRARRAHVSIFAERYAYPANQFGRPLAEVGGEPCAGAITFQELADEPRSAYRIGGNLTGKNRKRFQYVLFGDAQGVVKGVALARRDIDGPTGPAGRAYFDGYFIGSPDVGAMRCIR